MNRYLETLAKNHRRGMTLIELMIVVAIVGILASVAGVALFRNVKQAKITKLKQFAMDVARGEESFRSRHGVYYPPTGAVEDYDSTDATISRRWGNLLEFKRDVPADVTVQVEAGEPGSACTICVSGVSVDTNVNWFAVKVEQDLDPGDADNTAVYSTSAMSDPLVINENK